MNNYELLAFKAGMQAHHIHQARKNMANFAGRTNMEKSVANFWAKRLGENAVAIINLANKLGVPKPRFDPGTPEYYTVLMNLARERGRQ